MPSFTRAVHAWIGLFFVLILASNLGAQARQPNVDLSMNNSDFRSPALCELSCYAPTYSFSTVPYYSLDQPRNVTLVYNGDQANPRPFIYADVHGASSVAVTRYTMRATVNGNAVTFLNGETLLTFTGSQPSTPVRLGGQFDARTVATDIYPLVVTVEATYADAVIGETSSSGHIMIVNEAGSQIAKGWTVAGHQRLKQTVSPGYMITNGDASATRFSALGVIAADFTTLTYDGSNGTYTRTYPDGSRTTFNAAGEHTALIAQNGHTVSYRYHPDGRLKYIGDPFRTQPSGPLTSIGLAYDANGLDMIQEPSADGTQWEGRQSLFVVDSNRCLVSAEDPDSLMTTFTCDSNGRLETITDRKGGVSTLVYNTNSWKLSQVKFPSIPVDAGNGTTTNKNPTTNYSPWQTKGVPTSATSSSSPWTAPVVSGVVGSVTDPAGRVTVLKANRFGQGIDITEPHGRRTIIASSFGFLPRKIIHPTGAIDTLAYDIYGRLTKSHPAGEHLTTYTYTAGGQLLTVAGPGARPEQRYYNASNQLDSITFGGPPAQSLRYAYDPATKRVDSTSDNSGHATTYAYDTRFGNLKQVVLPGNRTSTKIFDEVGRDSVTALPGLASQTTLYDDLNRVTSTSSLGTTITLGHNQLFQTDLYDANGNHYHTDYNALGWPINECDALSRCSTIRYDASGGVTSTTNRRSQRLAFVRDSLGRLTSQSGPGLPTNSYSYSSNGRIMAAWNSIQRDSIFIEPGSQTAPAADSVVTWIDGKRFRIRNRAPRAVADTALTTITSNTGVTFHERMALYSSSGYLSSLWIGPTQVTFVPDADGTGGTTSMPNEGTRTSSPLAIHTKGKVTFTNPNLDQTFQRSYHYDQARRLDQVKLGPYGSPQVVFGYDGFGRLTGSTTYSNCPVHPFPDSVSGPQYSCTNPVTAESFNYDAMGNRMDNGGVPTTGNRYASFDGATYFYDFDGNVTQQYKDQVYNREFFWNAAGQLDSAMKNGGLRNNYDYNALGKPVRIWEGDGTGRQVSRYLLWDGDALIAEFWPNGERDVDYVYLPGGIDRPFASTHGLTAPTSLRYQQLDELGNVIGTHQNGAVTQSTSYDAWGSHTSSNYDSHLHWKGLFWNSDVTGLYYMRNRWYDPEAGRFVSEDPAGVSGGINLYVFAGNDPINGRDPSGLERKEMCTYTPGYEESTSTGTISYAGVTECWPVSGSGENGASWGGGSGGGGSRGGSGRGGSVSPMNVCFDRETQANIAAVDGFFQRLLGSAATRAGTLATSTIIGTAFFGAVVNRKTNTTGTLELLLGPSLSREYGLWDPVYRRPALAGRLLGTSLTGARVLAIVGYNFAQGLAINAAFRHGVSIGSQAVAFDTCRK